MLHVLFHLAMLYSMTATNMEWHVKVEPGAELELKLTYVVEYPAQDAVEGLPK